MTGARISGLFVYPVKSMKGVALERAVLTPLGLEHDRRFMVVRGDGSFVTQRDTPLMALVETALEAGGLTLSRPGFGRIRVPFDADEGAIIQTRVWKDECETADQGEVISRWLTAALESVEPLRLVAMAAGFQRPQGKPDRLGADTRTLFADAAPYLVAGEASLAALNRVLAEGGRETVPMNRFRPNVVVSGTPEFAEHAQTEWAGDGYAFRLCYPCQRCIVTTIDQSTARKNPDREPYRTLAGLNPMPGRKEAPAFGQNAILSAGAGQAARIGDLLSIKEIPA